MKFFGEVVALDALANRCPSSEPTFGQCDLDRDHAGRHMRIVYLTTALAREDGSPRGRTRTRVSWDDEPSFVDDGEERRP